MEENRLSTIEEYKEIARGVKLIFRCKFSCNVSFMERTFKSKFVLPGMSNLFSTDWTMLFDLWECLINSFCKKVDVTVKEKSEKTEKFI